MDVACDDQWRVLCFTETNHSKSRQTIAHAIVFRRLIRSPINRIETCIRVN